MKEVIGAAVFFVGMLASSNDVLRKVNDAPRAATLRRVGKGLPPVPRFQKSVFVVPHR